MAPGLYLIAAEKTPNSRQEPLKGRVIHTAIAVEEPLHTERRKCSNDFMTFSLTGQLMRILV